MGPRRFASIHELRRAHRGPGGYCRHSGNQGTTGRPARAHDTFQKISLRTRLSKPGEPREGHLLLAEGFSSVRDHLSSRGHLGCHLQILLRTKPKGSAMPLASRSSFLSKPDLPPRQSAHGLCTLRRVTTVPARGDGSAAVAVLMYKGVNKTAPSKGAPRIATLVIREPSAVTLQG